MSIKNHSDLTSEITSDISNNGAQLITGLILQEKLLDMADSAINMLGDTSIQGKLGYSSLFTISSNGDIPHKKYVDDAIIAGAYNDSAVFYKNGTRKATGDFNFDDLYSLTNVFSITSNGKTFTFNPSFGGVILTESYGTINPIDLESQDSFYASGGSSGSFFQAEDVNSTSNLTGFRGYNGGGSLKGEIAIDSVSPYLKSIIGSAKARFNTSLVVTDQTFQFPATGGIFAIQDDLYLANNLGLSTGLYDWTTGIIIASTTTFNVGAALGYIVNSSSPLAITLNHVSYSGGTGLTTPYLLTDPATYLLVNTSNVLVMQNTEPTASQKRNNIFLGVIGHPTGTLTGVGNNPDVALNTFSQTKEMFTPIKFINNGIFCYANSTNLTLANTAGKLYGLGIGFIANGNSGSTSINISAGSPTTFQYRTQIGTTFANTTLIDNGFSDVAGTRTAIAGSTNQATNQRIYLLQNGNIRVQYGQTIYATLTDAVAAASNESFVVFANNRLLGILIGILSVTKGATNLSDTTTARFLPVSKFGETVGAAAGIAIGTLQTAYNNSAIPQISITDTLGELTLRNTRVLDTSAIFVGQNIAGATTFRLNGNGTINNAIWNAGTITASSDSDTTHVLGRSKFGSPVSDEATFSHFDNNNTTDYALKQQNTGATFLNTKTGTTMSFRISDSDKLTLSSSTFTIVSGVNLTAISPINAASISLLDTTYKTALDVSASGTIRLGNGFTTLQFGSGTTTMSLSLATTTLSNASSPIVYSSGGHTFKFGASSTGANVNFALAIFGSSTYAPTGSGTGSMSILSITPTYNQTSTANQPITGISYNPTTTGVLGEHWFLNATSGKVLLSGSVGPAAATFTLTSGATTSGQSVITYASNIIVKVGDAITGTGIPAGSYIAQIISATSAMISNDTPASKTATATNSGLTFTIQPLLYGLSQFNTIDNSVARSVGSYFNTTFTGAVGSTQRAMLIVGNSASGGAAIGTVLELSTNTVTSQIRFNTSSNIGTSNTIVDMGTNPSNGQFVTYYNGTSVTTIQSGTTFALSNGVKLQGSSTGATDTFTFDLSGTASTAIQGYVFQKSNNSLNPTSGNGGFINTNYTFAPASGTANWATLNLIPTINQTSTASGTVRGVYYNPTATSVLGTHNCWESTSGDMLVGGTGVYKLNDGGTAKTALDVVLANNIRIGNGFTGLTITPTTITLGSVTLNSGSIVSQPSNVISIRSTAGSGINVFEAGHSASIVQTTGTKNIIASYASSSFAPTTGACNFNFINANHTINQTNGGTPPTGLMAMINISPTVTSVITTLYGLRSQLAASPTGGGAAWNIYADGSAPNILIGKTGFGATTTPTALLMLAAGTASTNTAPLKFTSGTNLTSPEAGAFEFTTDNYFLTSTTGSTRKVINDLSYRAITALRTLDGSDEFVDCTSGTFAVTLPTAVGFLKPLTIFNSGTGVITINTTSSQTINGVASGVLTLIQYDIIVLRSNGTNWYKVN